MATIIRVQVIENLGPAIGNATITILGRKNSSCTDGVSYAEIGDSLVVGLSKHATDTFNISPCGVFALKLSQNKVTGRIQPGISTKNYDDFKFELYTCGNSAITIFPNPTKSLITVGNLNEDLKYEISIFSPSGELISTSSSSFSDISQINIENLRPGLYTIKIVSQYEVIIKRFIRQ